MSADDELRFGVPLVVRDIVMSLQPYPLLTFGQEAIVAGFALSKLHHWAEREGTGVPWLGNGGGFEHTAVGKS